MSSSFMLPKSSSPVRFSVPWMHQTFSLSIYHPSLGHLCSWSLVAVIKVVKITQCSLSCDLLDVLNHPLLICSRPLSHQAKPLGHTKSSTMVISASFIKLAPCFLSYANLQQTSKTSNHTNLVVPSSINTTRPCQVTSSTNFMCILPNPCKTSCLH